MLVSPESMPRSPTRPAGSPATRILATARHRLFAYGYNALTMDDLAHELGMSKKTLYVHFPGKDAIIGALIDRLNLSIRRDLEAVLADPTLRFVPKLRGIIDRVVPVLGQLGPALLRELQRFAPELFQRIDEIRRKNIPFFLGRLFRQGIAEGAVRPGLDPDFAAQFWLQTVRGLLDPDCLALTGLTPPQAIENALHLFAGGLLTPAGRKDYEKLFPA
jgi:AcrR family transcriptional regulator